MGRVAEFSDEEIIKAGNHLLSLSKVVTPFGIRQLIGGGSAQRIKTVWSEEVAKRNDEALNGDSSKEIELPAEMQEALEKSIEMISQQLTRVTKINYKVAADVAESRVASVIKKHEEKLEEYKHSEFEACQAIDSLAKENEELKNEVTSLLAKNSLLSNDNAKYFGSIDSLKSRLDSMDLKLESKQSELVALARENAELKMQVNGGTGGA